MTRTTTLSAFILLAACTTTLDQQRRMADLAEAALTRCRQDHAACRAAKLCSERAVEASKALQIARKATAEGHGDVGLDLDAALLTSGAESICDHAGVVTSGGRGDGGRSDRDGGNRSDNGTHDSGAVQPSATGGPR